MLARLSLLGHWSRGVVVAARQTAARSAPSASRRPRSFLLSKRVASSTAIVFAPAAVSLSA